MVEHAEPKFDEAGQDTTEGSWASGGTGKRRSRAPPCVTSPSAPVWSPLTNCLVSFLPHLPRGFPAQRWARLFAKIDPTVSLWVPIHIIMGILDPSSLASKEYSKHVLDLRKSSLTSRCRPYLFIPARAQPLPLKADVWKLKTSFSFLHLLNTSGPAEATSLHLKSL